MNLEQPYTAPQQEDDVVFATDDPVNLIVHNDDVNTFDWVIKSLVEICGHTEEQAEQCAMIIHFKGKYCVKTGPREELQIMKDGLIDRGINATLEEAYA